MPDITEYAEKHKDEVMNALKKLEESGGDAMKSNKVRMSISREMHEWFTTIDGKTNDERMQRVIEVNDDYKELMFKKYKLEMALEESRKVNRVWFNKVVSTNNDNLTLKVLLGLSMSVSIISVGYLAYVQGWFL